MHPARNWQRAASCTRPSGWREVRAGRGGGASRWSSPRWIVNAAAAREVPLLLWAARGDLEGGLTGSSSQVRTLPSALHLLLIIERAVERAVERADTIGASLADSFTRRHRNGPWSAGALMAKVNLLLSWPGHGLPSRGGLAENA